MLPARSGLVLDLVVTLSLAILTFVPQMHPLLLAFPLDFVLGQIGDFVQTNPQPSIFQMLDKFLPASQTVATAF